MTETTTQRTARLLSMSNAALIMHAQDLTLERDTLQEALSATVEQRDKLLAALVTAHATLDRDGDEWGICDQLAAAIASAKGGVA